MRRFNIDPDRAGLLAAAEPLRDQIRALVVELHRMRPTRRPVTMQQAAAWRRFQKAMGGDGYFVEYASVGEIADAVVDLIVGRSNDTTALQLRAPLADHRLEARRQSADQAAARPLQPPNRAASAECVLRVADAED